MPKQLRVFCEHFLVLWVSHEFKCLFLARGNEFFAYVRWPEVSWCFHLPTKSFFKLGWVEILLHLWHEGISRKLQFYKRLRIYKAGRLDTRQNCPLSPRHVNVVGSSQKEHKILLANITKSQQLLPRQTCHAQIAKVNNCDPLIYEAVQKHYSRQILE